MCALSKNTSGIPLFRPYDYDVRAENLYVYFNSDITGQDFGVKNNEFASLLYDIDKNRTGLKNV